MANAPEAADVAGIPVPSWGSGTLPMVRTRATFNYKAWQLGYQTRQFGVALNPANVPAGTSNTTPELGSHGSLGNNGETGDVTWGPQLFGGGVPTDISNALAAPPADMLTALQSPIDQAIAVTPTQ